MKTPTARFDSCAARPLAAMAGWLADAERQAARIAARRRFVHVKRCFMAAIERLDGRRGQWLKQQVRHTNAAVDLWLLRGAVVDALSLRGPTSAGTTLQAELQRALEGVMHGGVEDERALSMAM